MNPVLYLGVLACVLCIGLGQVLFKATALAIEQSGTVFALRPMVIFGSAFVLYSLTAIGWVLLLRHVELGKIYPFNALAFVIVPAMSAYFFGERFGPTYFIGALLIGAGIVLCVRT
jgi:drug/metabolite transporter (DMT)-like permease